MHKIFFSMMLIGASTIGFSQSVGIGTATPDASSVLELKATNKGFLPPRMTATEKAAIASPKAGLIIYQTDGTTGLYVYNGTSWEPVSATTTGSGWALNGNSNTNPASSFIGTRDNQPLKFRVNNIPSGGIHPTSGNVSLGMYTLDSVVNGVANVAMGYNALHANKDGSDNSAFGIATLFSNTSGQQNTAIGSAALVVNTIGSNNVSLGSNSMYTNTIGSRNVALGSEALYNSQTGNNNIAVGHAASRSNESGSNNIAIGFGAGYHNKTGNTIIAIGDSALYKNTASSNVAIGSKALRNNTTGTSNTAFGNDVLSNNIDGNQNTGVGRTSLFNNISGIQNTAVGVGTARYNQTGDGNTAIGFQSLLFNVDNSNNTAVGHIALASTIADDNTGVGKSALTANNTGTSNTAVGVEALATNTTGSFNTAIGYHANTWGTGFTNATAIGANAQAGCSDCVVLGATNGYNGATSNSKIGIGINNPQKTLHVNPNGAGGILIGNDMTTGGYTGMNMGISQASGGYSFIQSVKAAWPTPTYGDLVLNLSGGNVGIRKAAPLTPLHIKQSNDNPPYNGGLRLERYENANYWDISVGFADQLEFGFKGASKVRFSNIDGDIWTVSDMRLKKDIQNFQTALPLLMRLEPKAYHYKDNDASAPLSYGFIAQDVEKIFPAAVGSFQTDGMKAVAYQKLNILAIKSIQEQQVIIENQNKRIIELENKMEMVLKQLAK